MIEVTSTTIKSVGWEARKLTVLFRSGEVYTFDGVEQTVYDDLLKAESVGQYFYANVRGKFSTKKLLEGVGVPVEFKPPRRAKRTEITEPAPPYFDII